MATPLDSTTIRDGLYYRTWPQILASESWGTKGTFVKGVRNEPPLSFVLGIHIGALAQGARCSLA